MSDAAMTRATIVDAIASWADRGWLRRLDAAFATFVAETTPDADASIVLAAALVAHLEGRGHTCLVITALLHEPERLFDWSPDALDALRFVLARLPRDEADWFAAARASDAVFVETTPEKQGAGEPLVLGHGRLYLRRYWRHERRIANQIAARAAADAANADNDNDTSAPGSSRDDIECASSRSLVEQLFDQRTSSEHDIDWQRVAAALALRGRLTIVAGGPGTGKTWTAARLVALFFCGAATDSSSAVQPGSSSVPPPLRIVLAAPTGKAAARLKQSIDAALAQLQSAQSQASPLNLPQSKPPQSKPGHIDALPIADWSARMGPARTLHALLGRHRHSRRFRHDAAHPLAIDVLIVDEASMVHVEMMDALLDALPPTARLILIGDKDQLASVEAGAVLGELCRDADAGRYTTATVDAVAALTGQIIPDAMRDDRGPPLAQHTVMLRRGERFGGTIGALAAAVNAGHGSEAATLLRRKRDPVLHWTIASAPTDVVTLAVEGRANAPGYGAYVDTLADRPDSLLAEDHEAWVRRVLDAFDRFRVLCAVRDGPWGVVAMNRDIERRLVDGGRLSAEGPWYEGRPVMVARNDYDLGVFNGDIGIALRTSATDPRLRVHFPDATTIRSVGIGRLADIETAFALTVHKAQGSEFTHTALVLPRESARVVTRELLYTGITRARERFTLVTSDDATLSAAIAETTRRSSGIGAMLAGDR